MFDRPTRLDNIVGQTDIIKRVKISIGACQTQNTVFPHVLLSGAAGTGKTSIANCIASELKQSILIANGANLKSVKDLLPYLPKIKGGIFFIDEAHRVNKHCQDYLLTVVEDFFYSLGQNLKIELEKFTFIMGTTNIGAILKPLRDRCTFQYELSDYTIDEIAQIILNKSDIDRESAIAIAKSARKNPRTALARLRWVLDYSVSQNVPISPTLIKSALKLAKISDVGIEEHDRRYLSVLRISQPISLSSISSALSIDKETVREVIEPFLIKENLIKITTKGRMLI